VIVFPGTLISTPVISLSQLAFAFSGSNRTSTEATRQRQVEPSMPTLQGLVGQTVPIPALILILCERAWALNGEYLAPRGLGSNGTEIYGLEVIA
jgi:hypothetical protein